MSSIREFNIVKPPTSGEVQHAALEALQSSGFLKLTLIGQEEIPRPEPIEVEFRIAQTSHPEKGGMRITGMSPEGNSVIVLAPENVGQPAVASVVIP